MSSYGKTAPKHRASPARRAPQAALKTSLTLSSMAVVATGFAIGTGQLALGSDDAAPAAASAADAAARAADAPTQPKTASTTQQAPATQAPESESETESETEARSQTVTRSSDRTKATTGTDEETADPTKVESLSLGGGNAVARTEDMSGEDPRTIARALLAQYGWDESQFGCLDSLWTRESGWNPLADNPSSSAYGIPQALPGSKMASEGADWATNPVTQIRWGLGYIEDRYGSPCSAWGHSQATGFY